MIENPEAPANQRLRALELAIGSSERPVTTEGIVGRAAEFAAFLGGAPRQERGGVRFISPYIIDIVEKISGCTISVSDSEYLISCIRSRTRV